MAKGNWEEETEGTDDVMVWGSCEGGILSWDPSEARDEGNIGGVAPSGWPSRGSREKEGLVQKSVGSSLRWHWGGGTIVRRQGSSRQGGVGALGGGGEHVGGVGGGESREESHEDITEQNEPLFSNYWWQW